MAIHCQMEKTKCGVVHKIFLSLVSGLAWFDGIIGWNNYVQSSILMKSHDYKAQIYQGREKAEPLQSVAPGDGPSFHKL